MNIDKNIDFDKKDFVCRDCNRLKKCKEPFVSWIYFFIAILASIGIRAVNVVLDFSPLYAKIFWYIGVGGFFIFFLYKFYVDNLFQKELKKTNIIEKLFSRSQLTEHDYEVLTTIICKLNSPKDKINYFFIFFSSAVALIFALYLDFFK